MPLCEAYNFWNLSYDLPLLTSYWPLKVRVQSIAGGIYFFLNLKVGDMRPYLVSPAQKTNKEIKQ